MSAVKVKEQVVPAISDALLSHPDVRVRARARESFKVNDSLFCFDLSLVCLFVSHSLLQ